MNRLTDRMVSSGRVTASSRARSPTTTSPSGRNATAEGRSRAPVTGSGSTRGPRSSRTATRLFVVPRSMPMIRPTQSFSRGLLDVAEERSQIRDLGQAAPELVERDAGAVRLVVACRERVAKTVEAIGERRPERCGLTADGVGPGAAAGGAELLQLLLGLEHLRRDLGRDAGAVVTEPRPVELEPVPAARRSEERTSELQSPVHLVCRL